MSQADQLPIPENAKADEGSLEILRIWIANNDQFISVRTDVWDDPAAWGILMADVMRNIANSYAQQQALDPIGTMKRIKAGLDVELESPTN